MSETRVRIMAAAIAVGAFVLIMALEIATENDAIEFVDVAIDALVLLLTISSVCAAALLFTRIERHAAETREIVAALDKARRDGAGWRAAVEEHVNGLKSGIERQFDDWSMTPARAVPALSTGSVSH